MFKNIEGYCHYEVSIDGVVRNKVTGRLLKYDISNCGYARATLCESNIPKKFSVHRLVAETFLDKPHAMYIVNHIDGNKLNNKLSNLEWVSMSTNLQHAMDTGLSKIGSDRRSALINEDAVHEVCKMFCQGATRGEMLDAGIHPELKKHMVDNIRRRRTWKHVSKHYNW